MKHVVKVLGHEIFIILRPVQNFTEHKITYYPTVTYSYPFGI